MRFENAYLPVGGYWSSPFSKWQGSLQNLHSVKMAADVTTKGLERAGIANDLLRILQVLLRRLPAPWRAWPASAARG